MPPPPPPPAHEDAASASINYKAVPLESVELSPLPPKTNDQPGAERGLPEAYKRYLDTMQAAWKDLPDLTITYKGLGYTAVVPRVHREIPNLLTGMRDALSLLNPKRDRAAQVKDFHAVQNMNGVVRPGEMTLVLAPPGHGKSMLLKALAGRSISDEDAKNLRGEVRWNGLTAAESLERGVHVSKLTAYVDQGDVHYPMLTVRETFEFALRQSNANVSSFQQSNPEWVKLQESKVDLMLELLGLRECADTIIGNAMIRGVSGGQKKRVTLGEMMITQARALFLDEISTGLDSAATLDIVTAVSRWCKLLRGSATMALLQPTPEVFEQFDNVILLREGQIVFNGTQKELRAHFEAIRIEPNPEIDFADWLTEFLTAPLDVWKRDIQNRRIPGSSMRYGSFRQPSDAASVHPAASQQAVVFHLDKDSDEKNSASAAGAGEVAPSNSIPASEDKPAASGPKKQKGLGQIISAAGIPLTTAALAEAFQKSKVHQDVLTEISDINANSKKFDPASASPLTKAQYFSQTSHSFWEHTKLNLDRQKKFYTRSPEFVGPRISSAIFMGLVAGSLNWQLTANSHDFVARYGVMLFSMIFMAFGNSAELPLASEFKQVIWKQVDSGFYSTAHYVISVLVSHLPLAFLECGIFGTLIYWMAGFTEDVGRYFFFLLIILCVNLAMSCMFRAVAYVTPNPDVALNLAGPITAFCLLFGGFLITKDKIPNYCIWIYYLSPFSWGLRSQAQNEFLSARYDNIDIGYGPEPQGGEVYLRAWQVSTDRDYKWAGFGYLIGLFCFTTFLATLALAYTRRPLTTGTRRMEDESEDTEKDAAQVQVLVGAKYTSQRESQQQLVEAIAFDRMNISWKNLVYTVQVPDTDAAGKATTKDRVLLQNVNGFARAGELTALMGSSGAGKTTLMDVLAGRKTTGQIEGDIRVNGHPQTFPTFARLNSYCEQTDCHLGTDTVRDAIEFSAKLRLPSSVTAVQREAFVKQILDDLELTPIANRLIGDENIPGLSPGQLKRVTIGVELAANPAILFLDEPTSGLDSRAALLVVKVIRKIARRGRTVVCTIHQPSQELFTMFDVLLLLKSGGKEVYFGPIGEDAQDIVRYFSTANIGDGFYRPEIGPTTNPASWMLDVIGAGTAAKGKIADYAAVYAASPEKAENEKALEQLIKPTGSVPSFDTLYATSYLTQFIAVSTRLFTSYWRNTSYNLVRFFLMGFLGVIIGLVYRDLGDRDEAGMTSKMACIFMSAGFMGFLMCSNALPVIYRLREVFYRERASNVYAPLIHAYSLAIVELPYLFVCSVLYTIPIYFIVEFTSNADLFFRFLLIIYLVAIFASYFGQFLGSWLPNIQVANILLSVFFTFFFMFGGVFIQKGLIPAGWQWMYYISPLSKALVAIAVQQFYCDDSTGGCDGVYFATLRFGENQLQPRPDIDGRPAITRWEFAQGYLSTGKDWDWNYAGWLVLQIVVTNLLAALVIQKVSHRKR